MLTPAPPAGARCCRPSWSSPGARCGGPQRAVRHRLPQGGLRQARLPVAQADRAGHGGAGPPGADPRRGAQPQARHAGRVLRRPRPRPTGRSTTRGPRSTCCTGCSPGSAATGSSRSGDAIEFAKAVTPTQRRKRHLADGLPDTPGVYLFRAADDRPLYVGTSATIATRVRSYFTAAEKRARISRDARRGRPGSRRSSAPTRWRREVRELRLIAAHKPPYNRRSKFPERTHWLKLTVGGLPPAVRGAPGPPTTARPTSARSAPPAPAELAADRGARGAAAAPVHPPAVRAHAEPPPARWPSSGRCPAPCELRISPAGVRRPRGARRSARPPPATSAPLVRTAAGPDRRRSRGRSATRRPRPQRGRLGALLRATIRMQRLRALTGDRRTGRGPPAGDAAAGNSRSSGTAGWSRPASPPGRASPARRSTLLLATAETVRPGPGPTPCASAEETERVLAWLERPDSRLVAGQRRLGTAGQRRGAVPCRCWRPIERATSQPIGR